MNIQLVQGGAFGDPRLTEYFPDNPLMILGINPTEEVEEAAFADKVSGEIHRVIQWLPSIRLLFRLPCGMQLVPQEDWQSLSEGSAAIYPVFWETPNCGRGGGVLLQILACPDGCEEVVTSLHHHDETDERFYPVCGDVEIWLPDIGWKPLTWRTKIRPGTPHQLRVRKGFAITAIRMEGPYSVRGPDCMNDHIR